MTEQFYLTTRQLERLLQLFQLNVPIASRKFGNIERSDYEQDFRTIDLTGMSPCTLTMIQRLFADVPAIRGFLLETHYLGIEIKDTAAWTVDLRETIVQIILESFGLPINRMVDAPYPLFMELFPEFDPSVALAMA